MFILAQIIGLFSFLIALVAYHQKTKKKILSTMIISNTLNFIHYFLLDAISGGITKIVAVIRDILIINKKNSKSIFYIFVIIYLILGISLYDNLLSIIPILASFITTIAAFFGSPYIIKIVALLTFTLWLIYNIFVLSFAGILSNIVAIISTIFAIKKVKTKFKT